MDSEITNIKSEINKIAHALYSMGIAVVFIGAYLFIFDLFDGAVLSFIILFAAYVIISIIHLAFNIFSNRSKGVNFILAVVIGAIVSLCLHKYLWGII